MALSPVRRLLLVVALLLAVLAPGFFFLLPLEVAGRLNRTHAPPPYRAADAATALHGTLRLADLHADSLLWARDLASRSSRGHLDLPRLLEAGVTLQVFSAVTKTPRFLNFERNDDSTDNIQALVFAQRWPRESWTSLTERALYQARRLHALAAASGDRLVVVKNRSDLAGLLGRRMLDESVTGGLLAIEGMHALDGDPYAFAALYDAGYRIMGLAHFFDNALGGSAHGVDKGGLTPLGRQLIELMDQRGVIIDLAHASPRLIDEVLETSTRPVIVSHTGVRGTCDRTRNLSDAQLLSIAARGGLIGIAYFEEAVCGTDADAVARAVAHAVSTVGADHVALGSDFDGAVATPFDVTGLPLLTEALLEAGLREDEIRRIMGDNVLEFLLTWLPDD